MVERLADAPRSTRVLDLGCAGGRNAVWLAEHGFDLHAVDASDAMCARTRDRLGPVLGRAEAERRVHRRPMDDLAPFGDGAFDVILAFGIFHAAQSEDAWHRAVAEAARVLVSGGEMWVAHFAPESDPTGEGLRRVEGEDHLYEGFRGHRHILLLQPGELDAWAAGHGFVPVTPTEAVRVVRGEGYRTTVNARYRLEGV
ncbi:MAG: class I SAM-dependent methyltransferase [Trueperaceae bacterium]|nr:class I SAM-dependent methyltransferase [Trueperaceae bacterium]